MLTYTVEHNRGLKPFVEKTLYIEGKADSTQLDKLKTIFFDALNSSDHLIVNIRKVEEIDYLFTVLICSIRRTARLLGKRLTIEGKSTDFFASMNECALLARKNAGVYIRNTPGYLWEGSAMAIPWSPGGWRKRMAFRKPARKR